MKSWIIFLTALFRIGSCWDPPEPIAVTTPAETSINVLHTGNPGFYIWLKGNHSVWYKTDTIGGLYNYIKLDKLQSKVLEKAIADYKEECKKRNKSTSILIKGDANVTYPNFNFVIEALKKNEEYKYNLITEPE